MNSDRLLSLQILREQIIKDPAAYENDFQVLRAQFHSAVNLLIHRDEKSLVNFNELTMFVAHTCLIYPDAATEVLESIVSSLRILSVVDSCASSPRLTLLKALLLLRNRQAINLSNILPVCFEMLKIPDAMLRKVLVNGIIQDFIQHSPHLTFEAKDLHAFFCGNLEPSAHPTSIKFTIMIFQELFNRNIWRTNRCLLNKVADHCFSDDLKLARKCVQFVSGKYKSMQDEEFDESDKENDCKATKNNLDGVLSGRANIFKYMKKTRGNLQKQAKLIKKNSENTTKFAEMENSTRSGNLIIQLLHNPHCFAEKALAHTHLKRKFRAPYSLRLEFLELVAQIILSLQLIIPDFYTVIQKYINPKQKQISKVMYILTHACHPFVPGELVEGSLKVIADRFVADYNAPEVISLGLYTIREMCQRCPLAMPPELLDHLISFRKFKNNIVVSLARSLLNFYRLEQPGFLHRRLRGKEASIALSQNQDCFKSSLHHSESNDTTFGLLLLLENKMKQAKSRVVAIAENVFQESKCSTVVDHSDHCLSPEQRGNVYCNSNDGSYGVDQSADLFFQEKIKEVAPLSKTSFLDPTDKFLTNKDLSRLKHAASRMRQHTFNQKRTSQNIDDNEDSQSSDGNSSNSSDSDEDTLQQDRFVFKPQNKRKQILREKAKFKHSEQVRARSSQNASIPERVKCRNKPHMMVVHKHRRHKRYSDISTRVKTLKGLVSRLKKKSKGRLKYRRM